MAKRFPLIPRRLRAAAALAAVAALAAACGKGAPDGKTDAAAASHAGGDPQTPGPSAATPVTLGGTPRPPARALPGDGGTSITAPLPEPVLGGIVGCWQLGDLETWTITRTPEAGAEIVRTVSARGSKGMPADYVQRAAVPSEIQYDASQVKLAFDTAGPKHGLLFVFQVTPTGLAGRWYSGRTQDITKFKYLGHDSVLERCRADGGVPHG